MRRTSLHRSLAQRDDDVAPALLHMYIHVSYTYEQPFRNRTRVVLAFLRAQFTLQIRRETSRARHVAGVVGVQKLFYQLNYVPNRLPLYGSILAVLLRNTFGKSHGNVRQLAKVSFNNVDNTLQISFICTRRESE